MVVKFKQSPFTRALAINDLTQSQSVTKLCVAGPEFASGAAKPMITGIRSLPRVGSKDNVQGEDEGAALGPQKSVIQRLIGHILRFRGSPVL